MLMSMANASQNDSHKLGTTQVRHAGFDFDFRDELGKIDIHGWQIDANSMPTAIKGQGIVFQAPFLITLDYRTHAAATALTLEFELKIQVMASLCMKNQS